MAGVKVVTSVRTANYGPGPMRDPIGIMLHHTAGRRAGDLATLTRRGTWVSANDYITKDGTVYELAPWPRRAWHAGTADRGTGYVADGNTYYWGIELENLGNGYDPYTKAQIDALVWRCRQICARRNITSPRALIRHKDYAPSRKIDPSNNFPFAAVRNRVFARNAPTPKPAPKPAPSSTQEIPLKRINIAYVGQKDKQTAEAYRVALNSVARAREMDDNFARSVSGGPQIRFAAEAAWNDTNDYLQTVVLGRPAIKELPKYMRDALAKDSASGSLIAADGDGWRSTNTIGSWRLLATCEWLGFGPTEKDRALAHYKEKLPLKKA